MSKPLVIVESPTKVRTVKKYLGNDYNVAATVGHVRDLPQKNIGIDIDNNFEPQYEVIPGKQKVISNLKKLAKDASEIYLAPDPDREGEAIAWHTAQLLQGKNRRFHRVLFHELTKNAILNSMQNPLELDKSKFEAQQIRRILDRLVGYQVSPLLWKKVQRGLSAGRVQTVAVRMICEREREIQAFDPEEYWSITAHLQKDEPPVFPAKLLKIGDKKAKVSNEEEANAVLKELEGETYVVDRVIKKTVKRNPLPPFTTSKLQQDSIHKLRFSAKKTMLLAQQLYEGIDLGPGEPVGLITYMRTDSTRVSNEAALEALDYIGKVYGPEYRPDKPRFFQNKKKVQDAHEAIRPTNVLRTPNQVSDVLSKDQLALYTLIWQRFVASQMNPALFDQTSVSVKAGRYLFHATGSTLKFKGYLMVYDAGDGDKDDNKIMLPVLEEKMILQCNKLEPKQHFTQPPPRFSEASLVKELEENGIGRPSTYAAILSTIRDKGYVDLVKRYFRPSELGFIVNDLLVSSFGDIFEVPFTAQMEDNLDKVETSQANSLEILNAFYNSFKQDLENAGDKMVSVKGVGVPTGIKCPQCEKELHIKIGKNGPFLACSGYPECRFTRNYDRDDKGGIVMETPPETEETDEVCDKCGKPMLVKSGPYGTFLGCSGYPDCKNTKTMNGGAQQNQATGIKCPVEGCDGEIHERRSKRGKVFYGCSKYPKCDFATWDKPVDKPCPVCQSPYLVEKSTKKSGVYLKCPTRGCKYREDPQ
ncbi:DNA topoisomerase I [Desulfatibacillum aliphaticivorans]|uniref:DNA topoisomerase 1 n=1 Tax=Desulfatibacillum aliphaticivorans TaxID=218208 RepID=B8F9E0_DESAL|nr:type I DNA topoisomerase [Desulfatibacillum aliphaticivorans]ACL02886.1 DNA topoisomerase I [Desulfatibacillum aliphaticivorans]